MKSTFVIMLLLLAIANTLTEAQKQPSVDTILNNNIILNNYIKCILGTGKCNREGEQLKSECAWFNVIRRPFRYALIYWIRLIFCCCLLQRWYLMLFRPVAQNVHQLKKPMQGKSSIPYAWKSQSNGNKSSINTIQTDNSTILALNKCIWFCILSKQNKKHSVIRVFHLTSNISILVKKSLKFRNLKQNNKKSVEKT